MGEARAMGVDWYRGGWVAVVLARGAPPEAMVGEDLEALVARVPDAACVGVDMPIGLPATQRAADRLARTVVGPRWPSAFKSLPGGADPGTREIIWY